MSDEKEVQEEKPRSPTALADAFARFSSKTADGARPIPRRRLSFVVDVGVLAPGVFEDDIEITLVSLTPEAELRAVAEAGGDSISMIMCMARASIESVNGQPVGPLIEFVWSALDIGGRQIVMTRFSTLMGSGGPAAGKALKTSRVH